MPTRREAADKVYEAITKLLLAYDTAPPMGKANISKSLTGLYAEYAALRGKPSQLGQPYSVLTQQLKQSATALRKVADDRASLANGLITAAQLLSTVSAVLTLIPA